jgi:uncharacterized membrane protein HdeD (DUF308 family)
MLLLILSLLDILAGILLIFPHQSLAFYIGIAVLIKGVSSLIGSILARDWIIFLGFIDLIVGLMLLMNFSISWFWVFPIIKGLYSLIIGLGSM